MTQEHKIELSSSIADIEKLNLEMESMLQKGIIFKEQFFNINLVLEEIFTNIVTYGFKNEPNHDIQIYFKIDDSATEITIVDDAFPFNPLEAVSQNLMVHAEEREIGGLGLFLVKQLMDLVSYKYLDGKNYLSLKKYKPL